MESQVDFVLLPIIGNFDKKSVMGKNTSIALGDHFESFISKSVESGQFSSASEVVRAGLRLLEEEEKKKRLLTKALIDGEESGFVQDFDPELLLKELHSKYKH
jgi:antitoxin ParD1/3/4